MIHQKMRRIKDKYFREPGLNFTRQWDGEEDLQSYLNEMGCSLGTAIEIIAKEADYDTFMSDGVTAKLWETLREKRNQLLKDSDDRFLSDTPSGRGSQEWRNYRQALRDLPANTPDPANPPWPTEPI